MDAPYFYTWTKQRDALTLPLDYVEDHYFCHKETKWLNLSSLSYQSHFGLKNKRLIKAMTKQCEEITLASPKHNFKLKTKVSQELIEKTPTKDYKCFYTLSGSEGIENALKMARQVSGRKTIAALKNSYHGATMGALSVTGDWRNDKHLLPRQWTLRIPSSQEDPTGEKLEETILTYGPQRIAAFCLETITGGNGVYPPSKKWFQRVQKICRKYNILLILDEVVCGAHRTGPFFGYQHYPFLKPDFIVLAKGISGGYFPIGSVLIKSKIANYYDDNILSCGLTNYAHPIGLSLVNEVLKLTSTQSFIKRKESNEKILKEWLKGLKNKTRSVGLLACIEAPRATQREIYAQGIYAPIQAKRLILAPPLTMPSALLKQGLSKLQGLL